jgi:hypothetical protein
LVIEFSERAHLKELAPQARLMAVRLPKMTLPTG